MCDGPDSAGPNRCSIAELMEREIAAAERAAIVEWLRMVAKDTFCVDDPKYKAVCDAADCIERGGHEK